MHLSPLSKLNISSENLYIYDIDVCCSTTTPDDAVICATLSDHTVHLFDSSLNEIDQFKAHRKTITSIEFSPTDPHILCTSSQDKTVAVWDTRQLNTPSMTFTFELEALTVSSSINSTLLATGSGNSIFFNDMRKGGRLGSYGEVHSDLVTSLKFNRNKPSILSSGAEDSLVSVFDTAVTSEKEAVLSILNVDCPLRRIGYFGADKSGLFCLTNVETASFWHYPSSQRVSAFPSIRTDINVDYLVNCVESADSLYVLGGSFTGGGVLAKIEPTSIQVDATLEHGHTEMLRTSAYLHPDRIVTGGEDGNICIWDASGVFAGDSDLSTAVSKKKRKL